MATGGVEEEEEEGDAHQDLVSHLRLLRLRPFFVSFVEATLQHRMMTMMMTSFLYCDSDRVIVLR